jgi:hypothetical protein
MRCLHAKRILATLLVVCILAVSGLASAQSITHESKHAHHQKSTHSTVLCSWLCAAGQVHDGTAAPTLVEQSPIALSSYVDYLLTPQITLGSAASRGPPHSAI